MMLLSTLTVRDHSVLKKNDAEAMDVIVTDQQDVFSDYGSDFTPDEEEILNALLHHTSEQDDSPNTDPNLLLKDIEDEERPRGARVPHRQGQQSQEYLPLPLSKTRVTIRLEGDNNYSANSRFRSNCSS